MPSSDRAWRPVGLLLLAVGWGANHFVALLSVYRRELGLDASAPAILLGAYALGLVPGLLAAGALSDRVGRRAIVLPAALLALVASGVLALGAESFGALLAGRFCYGLAAGAVMTPGAVWVAELSAEGGPRRATIALSAGFGLGPLVTGLVAELSSAPTRAPYVVHIALLATALVLAWSSQAAPRATAARERAGGEAWRAFVRDVAWWAPAVFALPTISFTGLPTAMGVAVGPARLGTIAVLTLASGVLVQPVSRRWTPQAAARIGLALGLCAVGAGALVVSTHIPGLLYAVAPALGAAYGICMTAGLRRVEQIAPATARGTMTGVYYVLTYVGFAAPYVMARLF